jgi:nucleoside-diphosphate-sugar epimerase
MGSAKKVLVTGATGFIGSRCLPLLIGRGYEVHAVTSQSMSSIDKRITWHRGDLLDAETCKRLMENVRSSHLLHLSWIAEPGKFWNSPDNLRWLSAGVHLVDAFYRNGGQHAVGTGTCAEYAWGTPDCEETTTALRPDTAYGRCKLALGLAFEAAAAIHGRSAAWARLFFPYGPGEPAGRLIPSVISSLLRGEPVDCTHGTQVRDFVYVDDVAAALVALLDSGARGPFNVGTGTGVSLREVIDLIVTRLGRADLVRFGARQPPPGDPERVVANTAKLKLQTGWQSACDLDAGIDATIAAWRQRLAS